MATASHTIHSHYDPKDRETLEQETGQALDEEDAWQLAVLRDTHSKLPPPRFTPATFTSTDWTSVASPSKIPASEGVSPGIEVSSWYHSLTTQKQSYSLPRFYSEDESAKDGTEVSQRKPIPRSSSAPSSLPLLRKEEKKNKNNWFIMRAMRGGGAAADSERDAESSATAPESLADIIARDPPPPPEQGKFRPPVFLQIGPMNRGFRMLERSGWSEGEPLGPDVVRRTNATAGIGSVLRRQREREQSSSRVKLDSQIIDLTLSDSDSDSGESDVLDVVVEERKDSMVSVKEESQGGEAGSSLDVDENDPRYGRKALLTPIATVLKADRLGIGLKAKTVGPYKASQKRVTHNAAALAAHIKAAEAARKQRALLGRGRRGYERKRKQDEAERKRLLQYMNT